MKIATMYRKDGKIVLETDNNAIAQAATDTPQDVVVEQNVPPRGIAALRQIATDLRRRTAGPPMPKPVLGVELHEFADRIEAAMEETDNGSDHVFWKKGDPGLPDVLTDRKGDVVLGMCRVCGQAEAELEDTCPGSGRSEGAADVNGVRERLARLAATRLMPRDETDLHTLLADHARLQADADRLEWLEGFVRRAYLYGASFDFAHSCEGEQGGYRFMTRRRLDARQPTLRAAIDAARAVQS